MFSSDDRRDEYPPAATGESKSADAYLVGAGSEEDGVFMRAMMLLVLCPGTMGTISTLPPQLITSSAPTTVSVV